MGDQNLENVENPTKENPSPEQAIESPVESLGASKPKPWVKIGVVTIATLLLLGTIGYLAYQNYQLKNQPTPEPTPTPTPSLSVEEETRGWKTFTSSEAKISFKYPDLWYVQDVSSAGGAREGSSYGFFLSGIDADPSYGDHRGNEVLVFNSSEGSYSIEELAESYKKFQRITVGGRSAIKAGSLILVPTEGQLIHLGVVSPQAEKYLDQILPTFKFLDQDQTDETAGWKDYSFEVWEGGRYSLTYPPDWELDVEYEEEGPVGKRIVNGSYPRFIRVSKDGYIFHLDLPREVFGYGFCFYPESEAYPPFYDDSEDFNFETLREFELIDSSYGKYVRGKIALLEPDAPVNDLQDKYYLRVCDRINSRGSIFAGFISYYLPSSSYNEGMIEIMDNILKSFHQI